MAFCRMDWARVEKGDRLHEAERGVVFVVVVVEGNGGVLRNLANGSL